jgi:hypothetical protein
MADQVYIPFGEEWKKEMAKFPKAQLIERLANLHVVLEEHKSLLVDTTKNLGHPEYGLSSSVTFAVDELRERAFDFLGVPKEPTN